MSIVLAVHRIVVQRCCTACSRRLATSSDVLRCEKHTCGVLSASASKLHLLVHRQVKCTVKRLVMNSLHCRLEDSPPAGTSAVPDQPAQSNPDPPQPSGKVTFGVQAKPLKVIHKKKKVVPENALETGETSANGHNLELNGTVHPPLEIQAGNGNALLGLGSYGSESDWKPQSERCLLDSNKYIFVLISVLREKSVPWAQILYYITFLSRRLTWWQAWVS